MAIDTVADLGRMTYQMSNVAVVGGRVETLVDFRNTKRRRSPVLAQTLGRDSVQRYRELYLFSYEIVASSDVSLRIRCLCRASRSATLKS